MGALGVAAVVARLFVGTAGDVTGRRTVVVAGSLIAGIGMLVLVVADSVGGGCGLPAVDRSGGGGPPPWGSPPRCRTLCRPTAVPRPRSTTR